MKTLSAITLFLAFGLMIACGGSDTPSQGGSQENTTAQAEHPGKALYKQYCVLCHGADGKLGLNGAVDLTTSELPREEAIDQVTNGKGLMTPFKEIMTEEEIEQVVDYVITMRAN